MWRCDWPRCQWCSKLSLSRPCGLGGQLVTVDARALAHPTVKPLAGAACTSAQHASFNPAAFQRQIQALSADLQTLATTKNQPTTKPTVTPALPAAL